MFRLTREALRRIRVEDCRQTEDEFGARLYRTPGAGDAIRAFEDGTRPIPLTVAVSVLGFQHADRVARGLEPAQGFPALTA